MKMEMEQLLSMGFPNELAAQALAATGGNSALKATEWILSHTTTNSSIISSTTAPSPSSPNCSSPTPSPSPFQPKLDRFFHSQSKPSIPFCSSPSAILESSTIASPQILENDDQGPIAKRPKMERTKLSSSLPRVTISIHEPLSERMRPHSINDIVGQDHLLGPNSILRAAMDCNRLPSVVFWGPPGTGKTSIAKAIVNSLQPSSMHRFVSLSAVTSGVKDVRDAVEEARKVRVKNNKRTVLFVDEVHRFNKSQQDSFLPVIEDGSIVFMGATTENPSFHLVTPLLSRCRVLTLNPLNPRHVHAVLNRAVNDLEKGLMVSVGSKVEVNEDAIDFISTNCDGDARVALNALEISATTAAARLLTKQSNSLPNEENGDGSTEIVVTVDDTKEAFQCKHVAYDKAGDEHYNLISALHKSMRGSDADAAIYWLARMLEGGEEPLYIARRLVRFSSEDVGLADPSALTQAVACYQACHFIGMPECNVILAQCVAYLALAPKSVAVYRAIGAAQKLVRESVGQNEGVPIHLRNAPTKLMKELGYGKDYIYTPDNPAAKQTYLPSSLQGHKFLNWPDNYTTDG